MRITADIIDSISDSDDYDDYDESDDDEYDRNDDSLKKFSKVIEISARKFKSFAEYEELLKSFYNQRIVEITEKFKNLNMSDNNEFTSTISASGCSSSSNMDKEKTSKDLPVTELSPVWLKQLFTQMKEEIKLELLQEQRNLALGQRFYHRRLEKCFASSSSGSEIDGSKNVVHEGVFCDLCGVVIHGIRYKCTFCHDFDLCERCESMPNNHNKRHIFFKIRHPVPRRHIPSVLHVCDCDGDNPTPQQEGTLNKNLYEAVFICDETVPDGTVMSPNERSIKSWRVQNRGLKTWSPEITLREDPSCAGFSEYKVVDVPHLLPWQVGIVSVPFTAPSTPGIYESYWNFCYKDKTFGHRLWYHFVVKEPGQEENSAKIIPKALDLETPKKIPEEKGKEVANIAEALSAVKEEHERGNILQRKLAVNSHTATPNNTPFDLTPPKSPDHYALNELKVTVEERTNYNQTVESDTEDKESIVSLSSSESDAEFVVIPMPKCFNMSESLASRHLAQYLQSEESAHQDAGKNGNLELSSVKLSKPDSIPVKSVFGSETVSRETGVPELSAGDVKIIQVKESEIHISQTNTDGSSSEISIIESGGSSPTDVDGMPDISSIHITINSDSQTSSSDTIKADVNENEKTEQKEEVKNEEDSSPRSRSATFPKFPIEGITSAYEPPALVPNPQGSSIQVLPERLVTTPLNAAVSIYKTAKAVISSIQHHPVRPEQTEGATGQEQLNPMEQLVEMGFCNRQQNENLLRKHKDDVALVVAELVNLNDNDWYANRHLPSTPPSYFD